MRRTIDTVGTTPCRSARAEADPWIPLKVVWENVVAGPRLYAYIRDPQQGYVELKVEPATGALAELVVIDLPRQVSRTMDKTDVHTDLAPILDRELWPWKATPDYLEPKASAVDIDGTLSYTDRDGQITIWFSEKPVHSFLAIGAIGVGLDRAGSLVAVAARPAQS